jgi:hypothetical protein
MSPARIGSTLPAIDDRLVMPETPYEIVDGELVRVSPADPPHGERHLQLCALIEAHTGRKFEAACDLLTRTSEVDDIAPDVSVYPDGPDPETGGRQLEQLAFEIVNKQTLGNAGKKAAKLAGRGVRRVFAIDVEGSRVLEWSKARRRWRPRRPTGQIADAALAVALPIAALIHSAKADDAMARALVAKRNPVIEKVRARGIRRGVRRGTAKAVVAVLAARGVSLKNAQRDLILDESNLARLERWLTRAITCTSAAELLSEP